MGVDEATLQTLGNAHTLMAAKMLRPRYSFEEALHLGPDRILALLGLSSIPTLLHIARLRQLVPCIRLRIREFWALVHWDSVWIGDIRGSLEWLASVLFPQNGTWPELWPFWRDMIAEHPGRWKALRRRAQRQAVQQEAWFAARLSHAGLLVRQLKTIGALLHSEALDVSDQRFCCAVCHCVFDSYNKWSLHAFKRHGRVMQGRGLLTGSQCQACLRHFRTNVRLCRHLRLTPSCRLRLQQAGHVCDIEPGVGSRKADDPAGSQAPVLQAAGPRLPLPWAPVLEERQRPVAEILDCLRHVDFDGRLAVCSQAELWSRIMLSFSCVCAPTDRLRHTVRAWADVVADTPLELRDRLWPCVEWLLQADLVTWLVPDPVTPSPSLTTFRDSELALSLLDQSRICLPPCVYSDHDLVVVAGPSAWEKRAFATYGVKLLFFSHEDCLKRLAEGLLPEYMEGPFEELRFVLIDEGLGCLSEDSPRSLPCVRFQTCLNKACLAGDLLRFFLRLLARGIPTHFITTGLSDTCRGAVLGLKAVHTTTHGGWVIAHRREADCSDVFHHFPN